MRSKWKCRNVNREKRNQVLYFRATIDTDWKKVIFLKYLLIHVLHAIPARHAWLWWRTNARVKHIVCEFFFRDLWIFNCSSFKEEKKWIWLRLETPECFGLWTLFCFSLFRIHTTQQNSASDIGDTDSVHAVITIVYTQKNQRSTSLKMSRKRRLKKSEKTSSRLWDQ